MGAVPLAATGRRRVLVADDDAVVRKLTERMLRRLGYHVVGASDGEAALRAFEKEPDAFDLVVLDVMMPKLKGPEALARMREIRPALKALFVSGYAACRRDSRSGPSRAHAPRPAEALHPGSARGGAPAGPRRPARRVRRAVTA